MKLLTGECPGKPPPCWGPGEELLSIPPPPPGLGNCGLSGELAANPPGLG